MVSSVALSHDGKRILTGSYDKTAILWDADTARPFQTSKGHTDAVTSVALSARRQARAHRVMGQDRDPVERRYRQTPPGIQEAC